jgi:hypothetical protein
MWDAFCKLVAVLGTVVNPDALKESFHHLHCIHIQQSLAEFGDLLTPERYAAELHLVELLDRTIERSCDRLTKLQNSRAKNSRVNPLQPDWMARKR